MELDLNLRVRIDELETHLKAQVPPPPHTHTDGQANSHTATASERCMIVGMRSFHVELQCSQWPQTWTARDDKFGCKGLPSSKGSPHRAPLWVSRGYQEGANACELQGSCICTCSGGSLGTSKGVRSCTIQHIAPLPSVFAICTGVQAIEGLLETSPGVRSCMIEYDQRRLPLKKLLATLLAAEQKLPIVGPLF